MNKKNHNIPKAEDISLTEDKESIAELYACHMLRAAYAYLGCVKGYTFISESMTDQEVFQTALGALEEINEALIAAHGLSKADFFDETKIGLLNKSLSQRTIESAGKNPHLVIEDCLAGPITLCKENGIWPYYLTKIMAYAFLYDSAPDGQIIKEYADQNGVKEAAKKYCNMGMEPELLQLIQRHYDNAVKKAGREDDAKVAFMKKAYQYGFKNEKIYKGCAQCTLNGLFKLTGRTNEEVFQCASAFSGGMALYGDGVCGGYSGGLMFMGSLVGRRLKEMVLNGDKVAQYISYTMAQRLRERFVETYGSVICRDIHQKIFGKSFCLVTKAVKEEFEAAGAHMTKCTHVVGTACAYIAEIIYDKETDII